MNITTILKKLSAYKGSVYGERAYAEMLFLSSISQNEQNKYDAMLLDAGEKLLARCQREGSLTAGALEDLEESLKSLEKEAKKYTVHAVGHAHIDMNWTWGYHETVATTLETFRTVLRLMDEYPEFVFAQSQVSTYQIVEKYEPEMLEEIGRRIREGRWEVIASTWVEGDKNLSSGEAQNRQILYAKRYLQKTFGIPFEQMNLDFEPDTFGHHIFEPEVLLSAGVTRLYHCRGCERRGMYRWRAPSGKELFVYQEPKWYLAEVTADTVADLPRTVCGAIAKEQRDFLFVYGVGDHGGGPTRRDLERLQKMNEWRLFPEIRFDTYRNFLDKMEQYIDRFPVYEGEANFIFDGCYTTQSRLKMANRLSENRLGEAEVLEALSGKGEEKPSVLLEESWHNALFGQFHDILPGSSIHEVYEQTKKEYAEIAETSAKLIGERMEALCGTKDESVTVWNTLGHRRNDVVVLGETAAEAMTDGTTVYPVQQTKDGAIVYAENLPSKGYQVLRPTSGAAAETPFAVTEAGEGYTLETPFYTIQIDANGEFTSLFDKENDREVLQSGTTGNELRIYEDKPLQYSAWNLDIFHTEKSWKVEGVRRMEWTENGPVRATLEIEREVMDTVIRQQIHFYAKDRRIDFETYVDWKFAEHVLKVHFPVDVHSDEATFDIQFGNVTRKLHTNTSWDQARFEVCGHKWADISEGSYGVSLMNDCKYGYSMKNRVMTQTLIKSGTEPNLTADQEEHFFTYSLYPHAGTWREAGTEQEALNLNVPAKAVAGAAEKDRMEFLTVDKRDVVLETVKKAEDGDGVIVRLYEVENARTKVTLHCAEAIASAEETDLLENPIEGALGVKENEIELTIKPYEIRTIRIRTAK